LKNYKTHKTEETTMNSKKSSKNNSARDFLDVRTFAGKEKTDTVYKNRFDEIINFEMKYF